MATEHTYKTTSIWEGNLGQGTAGYRAYERAYTTRAIGRPPIEGSSDPAFRGDKERWNPELLLVAALSECHMLFYLHRCAVSEVVVTDYVDKAAGTMVEATEGGGHFAEVVLRPVVTVTQASMVSRAQDLHHEAAQLCFIARSVNFPVSHEPRVVVAKPAAANQ